MATNPPTSHDHPIRSATDDIPMPCDVISSKIRLILSGRPTRTARTPSLRRPMAMLSTAGLPWGGSGQGISMGIHRGFHSIMGYNFCQYYGIQNLRLLLSIISIMGHQTYGNWLVEIKKNTYGRSPFLLGISTISGGPCSIAKLAPASSPRIYTKDWVILGLDFGKYSIKFYPLDTMEHHMFFLKITYYRC